MASSFSHPLPCSKATGYATPAPSSPLNHTAKEVDQLNQCRISLEQTLVILSPTSELARKIQDVLNEIRCQLLQGMPSGYTGDHDDVLQPSPLPRSVKSGVCTSSAMLTPSSPKFPPGVNLTPSHMDTIPFSLVGNKSHQTTTTQVHDRLNLSPDEPHGLVKRKLDNTDVFKTSPSTPPNQITSQFNDRNEVPAAPRKTTTKRARADASDADYTPSKRQRPLLDYLEISKGIGGRPQTKLMGTVDSIRAAGLTVKAGYATGLNVPRLMEKQPVKTAAEAKLRSLLKRTKTDLGRQG